LPVHIITYVDASFPVHINTNVDACLTVHITTYVDGSGLSILLLT
jgi:hypothetical protein